MLTMLTRETCYIIIYNYNNNNNNNNSNSNSNSNMYTSARTPLLRTDSAEAQAGPAGPSFEGN